MLGVGGVGVFCGRGHLQTREIKGNQGKRAAVSRHGRPRVSTAVLFGVVI